MFKNPHKRIYLAILLSATPFLYLFSEATTVGGFIPAAASITGFVGALILLWQFLLGIRFVASQIDVHYSWINTLHKRLGKWGTIFVFVHPGLQLFSYGTSIFTSFDTSSNFMLGVIWGRVGFYLILAIVLTSVLFRKKLSYRPWLYIHYLSYPALFFVFLHADSIGTYLNAFPAIELYWSILKYTFYALVFARIMFFMNVLKSRFKLVAKKKILRTFGFIRLNQNQH